jgi:hypothetical protein
VTNTESPSRRQKYDAIYSALAACEDDPERFCKLLSGWGYRVERKPRELRGRGRTCVSGVATGEAGSRLR